MPRPLVLSPVARARALVLPALLALGCAGRSASGSGARPNESDGLACPLDVPGTRVITYEAPNGVALTFGTDAAHVDAVRESTRVLANTYNMRHDPREGPAATPPNQTRPLTPGGVGPLPPSHASVRDVANGAAMEVVPLRESDLVRLRDDINARWKDDPVSCPPDVP